MPAVLWLRRWALPCALGAALVMLVVSGLIALIATRARGDIEQLLDQVPTATRYLRREIDRSINDPGSLTHRLQILADLPRAASARAFGGDGANAAGRVRTHGYGSGEHPGGGVLHRGARSGAVSGLPAARRE